MRKFWKIFGITLLSIVGTALIAVLIAIWLVFTPNRLTPIVRKQADKYITAEHGIGEVDLTFFRTFPRFGIHISEVSIINPVSGAQSDTLLYLREMVARIDARALWKRNEIIIDEMWAEGLTANAFFGEGDISNIDIFNLEPSSEPETDLTAQEFPFGLVDMEKASFMEVNLSYRDIPSGMEAMVRAFNSEIGANYRDGNGNGTVGFRTEEIRVRMDLDTASVMNASIRELNTEIELMFQGNIADAVIALNSPDVWINMDGEDYLKGTGLDLIIPVKADIDAMLFNLDEARLAIGKIGIILGGSLVIAENDDINVDMDFNIDKMGIGELLAMVPPSFTTMLEGIDIDGIVGLGGSIAGIYNDTLMPVVDAKLVVEETNFSYSGIPMTFNDIAGNIDAYIDMNDEKASYARINRAFLRTGESTISASGSVNEVLSDNMKFNFNVIVDLLLDDFKDFVPEGIAVSGKVKGPVNARLSMAQLDRMDIEAMNISGSLDLSDFVADMDTTIHANSNKLKVDFNIPNNNPEASLANLRLYECEGLDISMSGDIKAALKGVSLTAEVSNILADTTSLTAFIDMALSGVDASIEDIYGTMSGITGNAIVKMDMIDTIAMPSVKGNFAFNSVTGMMDTMSVNISQPRIAFTLDGTPEDKGQIMASIDYQGALFSAAAGDYSFNTETLRFTAEVKQDSLQENVLLQWNPVVSMNLNGGNVYVPDIAENILIPMVIFDFNSERAIISEGRFNIGPSDFRITGAINNIVEYVGNNGLLQGELNFTSELTDVNYFMDIVSGMGVEADSVEVDQEEVVVGEDGEGPNPFMVPMGVDIVLNTNINRALVGDQVANNLGGKLYVKDGVLVLEEMGFVSEATRLQLTAIYKSPRKNHLYVGLDYHMLDIEIDKLLEMIPDIDTVMPMLKAFHGNGEYHMAIETYLNANYDVKMSTLRGAVSIKGEDLVVMDSTIFKKIRRLTLMGRKTENKIDSINAEITVFRDEVDVYPLMISMGRYQAILGGRHNLDMTYDYHLSLTKSPLPIRLGINVFTKPKGLKVRLARTKYAADYRPEQRYVVDAKQRELRAIIRDALTANVRDEEEEEPGQ